MSGNRKRLKLFDCQWNSAVWTWNMQTEIMMFGFRVFNERRNENREQIACFYESWTWCQEKCVIAHTYSIQRHAAEQNWLFERELLLSWIWIFSAIKQQQPTVGQTTGDVISTNNFLCWVLLTADDDHDSDDDCATKE